MKKSLFMITILLLSLTMSLVAVPNAAAQRVSVTELWSNPMNVNDVAVSRNGNYIAAVNNSGLFFFRWDSSTPLWWYNHNTPTEKFLSVAISADGSYVIVGNNSYPPTAPTPTGSIYYFGNCITRSGLQAANSYDWTSRHFWGSFSPDVERRTIDISDNGEYVAVGGTGDNLYYFFGCTQKSGSMLSWDWTAGVMFEVLAVDMSPDGQYIALGGNWSATEGDVGFISNANYQGTHIMNWTRGGLTLIRDVAVSDDGSAVAASGGSDHAGNLYYWANAKALTDGPPSTWNSTQSFADVDMSSNGNMVVGGAFDFSLHFWNGALIRSGSNSPETWTNLNGELIYDVAISNDGEIIAAVTPYGAGVTSQVYFLTYQNFLIGNFTEPYGLSMLSMSGDGGIVAAGGATIDSLHVYQITRIPGGPVGGELMPVDMLGLLAPYIALAVLLAGTVAAVVLLRRRIP
jgi:hypothetical protein